VIGSDDHWTLTQVATLLRSPARDVYTTLFTYAYPGEDRPWHLSTTVEPREGKVVKETTIFGAAFDAPEWRAHWVERI
jgi:hypothetical protein